MKKTEIEVWKSSSAQEERHYFIPNRIIKSKDYWDHTYLIGYNPQIIDKKTFDKILALLQPIIDKL